MENTGDNGFYFEKIEGSDIETLKWMNASDDWKGWVVADWFHGHPQFFWLTNKATAELPDHMEIVHLGQGPR